ncbi:MAG: bifunctional UDP-N-acetylglucosamine diphosphorylase/glucosamine-1-phosphate N-acetyltransferase GlmU [Alphaproteobacteria bacterium]|tara:strand:+ start:4682 stop:6040 length:1359 start_codon:yes stop_codon:yes gene_type:complete
MMSNISFATIILAAGLGKRMKSNHSKVMHKIAGQPMILHLLNTLESISPESVTIVVGEDMDEVTNILTPYHVCIQPDRLGTGDAVKATYELLKDFIGPVLILFGDTPMVKSETMFASVKACSKGADVVVVGFQSDNPKDYGRLVTDNKGNLIKIVESVEASDEQLEISLCNSGLMVISGRHMFDLLMNLNSQNKKGEYYLTDIVSIARNRGLKTVVVEAEEVELMGINSRDELSIAEANLQKKLRKNAMENGVTLVDPTSVWLSYDTVLGRDVIIHPNVVFGKGVTIGNGVEIKSFSHIEGTTIDTGAIIGPFARLRPGSEIGCDAKVGNFVEIKNTVLGPRSKTNHLSYIGDANVGSDTNIGAGTITCNYDGFNKHQSIIGNNTFIGSNTALIAPINIGDGAVVAAGSTISRDVMAGSLALGRAEQEEKKGWAISNKNKQKQLSTPQKPKR